MAKRRSVKQQNTSVVGELRKQRPGARSALVLTLTWSGSWKSGALSPTCTAASAATCLPRWDGHLRWTDAGLTAENTPLLLPWRAVEKLMFDLLILSLQGPVQPHISAAMMLCRGCLSACHQKLPGAQWGCEWHFGKFGVLRYERMRRLYGFDDAYGPGHVKQRSRTCVTICQILLVSISDNYCSMRSTADCQYPWMLA